MACRPAPEWELAAAAAKNLLPITSACNVRCVFCSHRQNPPALEVFFLPHQPLAAIRERAAFLDPGKKIIIGESVTRIMEGEPLLNPEVLTILGWLRRRFRQTTIALTTNGTLLTPEMVSALAEIKPFEVTLSLNSATAEGRRLLMGDRHPEVALAAPYLLARAGIPFSGSIVAMPHLVGWEDVERTVRFLAQAGAETVRIFLPGYTRIAPPELRLPDGLWAELKRRVASWQKEVSTPLLVEPPGLTDLKAEIHGVLPGTPAAAAGLRPGEIVVRIAGEAVFSRVDAFRRLQAAGLVTVETKAQGKARAVQVTKMPGARSGLVFDYDLSPAAWEEFLRILKREQPKQVVVATSELAAPLVRAAAAREDLPCPLTVLRVPSRFFGGNICCAGLLTVEDFQAAIGALDADLFVLPGIAFDARGRDLTGRSYVEAAPGRKVVLLDA
jgi:pyruvate-formate lyase-activating enzyme